MIPHRLVVACAGALLAACSAKASSNPYAGLPFLPAGPDSAPDPSKMGPYPVGVATYSNIYDFTRTDQWGNPRQLVCEVWYPATNDAIGQPGKAYNLEDLMTDQERSQVQDAGLVIPLDTTVAVENAAPRLEGAPYPFIVFDHGQAGINWQSTFYTVQLASHGYVVVSPNEPGDTLQDAFDLQNDPPLLDSFYNREIDVAFLISYFTGIQNVGLTMQTVQPLPADDLLSGMMVTKPGSPIGVTGHSYGALTALRSGFLDSRVKAIVPQAPTSAAEALIDVGATSAIITTPSLIEGAGKDHTLQYFCQNGAEAYTQTTQPRGLLNLLEAGHFTYSDLCKFNLGNVANKLGFVNIENVISDGCGPNFIPGDVAYPIINNYAIGFFNWQLRGSTGTLKYLTQEAGDALAAVVPEAGSSCVPDTCDPGQSCCYDTAADAGLETCCVLSSNPSAGQSSCGPDGGNGLLCDATSTTTWSSPYACKALDFTADL